MRASVRVALCYLYIMFPVATGRPVCLKRSAPWNLGHCFLHCFLRVQVLFGVRERRGWGCWVPEAQRRYIYGSARGLPRMPVRSLPARHVLMGPLTLLTSVLLRPTRFVIHIVTTVANFLTVEKSGPHPRQSRPVTFPHPVPPRRLTCIPFCPRWPETWLAWRLEQNANL